MDRLGQDCQHPCPFRAWTARDIAARYAYPFRFSGATVNPDPSLRSRRAAATARVTAVPINVNHGQAICVWRRMASITANDATIPQITGTAEPPRILKANSSPPRRAPLVRPLNSKAAFRIDGRSLL